MPEARANQTTHAAIDEPCRYYVHDVTHLARHVAQVIRLLQSTSGQNKSTHLPLPATSWDASSAVMIHDDCSTAWHHTAAIPYVFRVPFRVIICSAGPKSFLPPPIPPYIWFYKKKKKESWFSHYLNKKIQVQLKNLNKNKLLNHVNYWLSGGREKVEKSKVMTSKPCITQHNQLILKICLMIICWRLIGFFS